MSHVGFELSTCRMYNKLAAFTNTASVVQWIVSSTVARETPQGRFYKANRLFIKTKKMNFVIK